MKSYNVTDVKPFMAGLLTGDLFTGWELRTLELSVLSHIEIDGAVNELYLSEEEKEKRTSSFILWDEIQQKVRALIAGGKTPSGMKLSLACPDARDVLDLPSGFTPQLNIRFSSRVQEGKVFQTLTLYSAMSSETFSLDKTPERLWEEYLPAYFRGKNILLMEEST